MNRSSGKITVIIVTTVLIVFSIAIYWNSDWELANKIMASFISIVMLVSSLIANILTIGGKNVFKRSISNWDYSFIVANNLLQKIEKSNFKPDLVIGLGRSGGIWGGWVAGNLGSIPFYSVETKYTLDGHGDRKIDFPYAPDILGLIIQANCKNILIVEGAASTGATFVEFKRQHLTPFADKIFKFAVLFKNSTASISIDFIGETVDNKWPEKFPWHIRDQYSTHLKT
jgi:hypoxanthine phosphoribosyltransferase